MLKKFAENDIFPTYTQAYTPATVFGVRSSNSMWAERMRIDSAENVGVATTSPFA